MRFSKDNIHRSLSLIPNTPGCYLYRDKDDTVIYVGKAKSLNKRISSYFNKPPDSRKTAALLNTFSTIEYIVVSTEHDALLLESNLIKQYQPRYNILLKQGNTYPYISIKSEPFPRVVLTHTEDLKSGEYFGPFPNRGMAWGLMKLFQKIYRFRTCSLALTPENISKDRFRVCLKYHIKRCDAPCIGEEDKETYNKKIESARKILLGKIEEVKYDIYQEIKRVSEQLDFESAYDLQQILTELDSYQAKSTIINNSIGNALALSYDQDQEAFYVNYLLLSNGNIIAGRTLEYKLNIEYEEAGDRLLTVLQMLLSSSPSPVEELILSALPEYSFPGLKVSIPKRGDRKNVLELSKKNLEQYIQDKRKQQEKLNPEQRNIQLLRDLQATLGLESIPYHIECFDNSNISGASPVAACVVFKGARAEKKLYRHYHIKTVVGSDDYASLYEVITRRYERMIRDGEGLPDLIITDGGKGHMNIVQKALTELNISIPILGLAKDDKHNTSQLLFGSPPVVIGVLRRSPLFHLLERIQKEVHRFAIAFHRKERSKKAVASKLDGIPGVGKVTKEKLLRSFGSLKKIEAASLQELQKVLGVNKGETIFNRLKQ